MHWLVSPCYTVFILVSFFSFSNLLRYLSYIHNVCCIGFDHSCSQQCIFIFVYLYTNNPQGIVPLTCPMPVGWVGISALEWRYGIIKWSSAADVNMEQTPCFYHIVYLNTQSIFQWGYDTRSEPSCEQPWSEPTWFSTQLWCCWGRSGNAYDHCMAKASDIWKG